MSLTDWERMFARWSGREPTRPRVGIVAIARRRGERMFVRLDEYDPLRRRWRARVVDETGVLGLVVEIADCHLGATEERATREAPYRPPARKRYGVGQ